MKKPTRSEIEHRAIEKILNMGSVRCANCKYYDGESYCSAEKNCTVALMETALEEAEKELTALSSTEKATIESHILDLKKATWHGYTHIMFKYEPVAHVRYYHNMFDYGLSYDAVVGSWWVDMNVETNKKYSIEELLNG